MRWRVPGSVLVAALGVTLLAACSTEPGTGPVDVRWDREVCKRCSMALGDRYYAAQVRLPGEPSMVHRFDDIGCAVVWMDEHGIDPDGPVEIWVTDYLTGDWIDAVEAWYVAERISPMGYGLGARSGAAHGAIRFEHARAHIMEVEKRTGLHRQGGERHAHSMEVQSR